MCNVVADNSHLYCVTSTYQLLRPSLYINPLAPEFVIFSETISPLLLDDMLKGQYSGFTHVPHIPVYEATKQPIRITIEILLQKLMG